MSFALKLLRKARDFLLRSNFRAFNRSVKYVQFSERTLRECRHRGFCAQHGQDYFIKEFIFDRIGRKLGTFLDIGCNDPFLYNNTFAFEKAGWKGIAVDPLPLNKRWAKRKANFVQCALGAAPGTALLEIPIGPDSIFPIDMLTRVHSTNATTKRKSLKAKSQEVRIETVNNILAERNVSKVDFVTCDVEGFEINVFQGFDLKRFEVDVICVENDRPVPVGNNKIRKLLKSFGYIFFARIDPVDDIYVSRSLLDTLRNIPASNQLDPAGVGNNDHQPKKSGKSILVEIEDC